MLNSLSLHQITNVEMVIPSTDLRANNWVEITFRNNQDEKFELTLFLKHVRDEKDNVDIYCFLSELRESIEKAIKEILDVQRS
jgi:hypothetical protein